MTYEELKLEAQKIVLLLDDPHPGIGMWQECLCRSVAKIREGYPERSDHAATIIAKDAEIVRLRGELAAVGINYVKFILSSQAAMFRINPALKPETRRPEPPE